MIPSTSSNAAQRIEETPILVNSDEEIGSLTPPNIQSVFLGILLIISLLVICNVAAEIILPTVLAFILKLVLHPVLRSIVKLRVPRTLAAIIVIGLLFAGFFTLGNSLSKPASEWARVISESGPDLQQRLNFVIKPVRNMEGALHSADGFEASPDKKTLTVAVEGTRLSDKLITNTKSLAMGIGQTFLVLFFLLAEGDTFLRRTVEILPRFKDKRNAVTISQQIESDISSYLLTISAMNALVGIATGLTMFICKVPNPALWGTVAFLLNYLPIMGPITGIILFGIAGLLSIDGFLPALIPAGVYLIIHLLEAMCITPIFVAKRFTLNPVLVILSLVFWYWMWGVPGAILSTPMLAIIKIIFDHIPSLQPLGHFLEGETKIESFNYQV